MSENNLLENPQESSEQETITELTDLVSGKMEKGGYLEMHRKIRKFFEEELLKDYSREDLQKYKLFHVLLLSGVDDIDAPYYDLPDGRIEKYIREEL